MCLTKDLEFENMSCQEATKRLRKINEYSNDNKLTKLNVLINKLNPKTAGGEGDQLDPPPPPLWFFKNCIF